MKLIDIFRFYDLFLLSHAHQMRNEGSGEDHIWYTICLSDISHLPKWVSNLKHFANVALYFFLLKFGLFFADEKKGKINGEKTLEIWTCAWKRSQDKLAALSVKQRRWCRRRMRRKWDVSCACIGLVACAFSAGNLWCVALGRTTAEEPYSTTPWGCRKKTNKNALCCCPFSCLWQVFLFYVCST